MEPNLPRRTVCFDAFDAIELRRCGVSLPAEEMAAGEAAAFAYKLRHEFEAEDEDRRQRLTMIANEIVDCFPDEYLAYLKLIDTTQ